MSDDLEDYIVEQMADPVFARAYLRRQAEMMARRQWELEHPWRRRWRDLFWRTA